MKQPLLILGVIVCMSASLLAQTTTTTTTVTSDGATTIQTNGNSAEQSSVESTTGFLNVITGNPDAQIFVNGEYVANDFINKMQLDKGQHYVRVEYNGQLMYAKMVTIYPDRLQTITSENFVDVRTKTASRGAIERESRRLQATKGTVGLGFIWGENYPAKGMSLKWFSPLNIGLQFSAIGNHPLMIKPHLKLDCAVLFSS